MIDGSRLISRKMYPLNIIPMALITTEIMKRKMYMVLMAFWTLAMSFAPKYWDTTMVNPMVIPIIKEISRKITGPDVPTAANAPFPMNLPTTMLSTTL